MSENNKGFLRRAGANQRGQALIFVTLSLTMLLGFAGFVTDIGRMYVYYNALNASTQAAALAGAGAMSQPGATVSSATSTVTAYSSTASNKNAMGGLTNIAIASGYPTFSCLSTLTTVFGLQCAGPSSSNAVVVKQQATMSLFFLQVLGLKTATLTATATASMKGAYVPPYNVAIIVDSTHSMNDTDSDSNCNNTRLSCALAGVQILLQGLSPCLPTESSCGAATGGNVSNSYDRVSLMTFPSVSTAMAADDYNCSGTNPTTESYATPFPSTSTYQIVNFSSDYRSSDNASSLSSGSNIVAAVNGKSGCSGIQAIGGAGTYYAQVIYAAQAYLASEQSSYPNAQNVMILLSDGDANATAAKMPGASTTSGTYVSTVQQCHQAVTAAAAAAAAGTRVYAVAYGAEASGCPTDISPAITPCQTMQGIASSKEYFFSDYTATGGSSACISASQPVTGLNQIFKAILIDLSSVKLIPNNTT
jgi:Putative Flp pilus-assembly TadE/G-like/von Willebrand factor type A domain